MGDDVPRHEILSTSGNGTLAWLRYEGAGIVPPCRWVAIVVRAGT